MSRRLPSTRAVRRLCGVALLALLCATAASVFSSTSYTSSTSSISRSTHSAPSAANDDPVLQALLAELSRSKAQLKMENVATPYYIEYRVTDVDEYDADAVFGALRMAQHTRVRVLRAVVRVGDYKQDSYFGQGTGSVNIMPLDDDPVALRRQVWWATDEAYKTAVEALTAKQAMLKQFRVENPVDDFARAEPVEFVAPLARVEADVPRWQKMLENASEEFRNYPDIQSVQASLRFSATNRYFVNTEGTATREGQAAYYLSLVGSTQAADGMRLTRSPYWLFGTPQELPTGEQFSADCIKMLETLKRMREAPKVEGEYRGPVLFAADAANDIFAGLIGENVLGQKPEPGRSMRTVGEFSSSFHARVLPDFLTIVDDPTAKSFAGHSLVGSYNVDSEGVRPAAVTVIKNGELVSYLLGRQPIRDFPASNGHGRAGPGEPPAPGIGNLFVRTSQALSREELKKKLIELCAKRGLDYGYFAETLLGPSLNPRLLYRVWVKDGREELVRGAVFGELDTRALRNNLVAAGDDAEVSNRTAAYFSTMVSPSILLDEVEVRPADAQNEKLPEYPPPTLGGKKRP